MSTSDDLKAIEILAESLAKFSDEDLAAQRSVYLRRASMCTFELNRRADVRKQRERERASLMPADVVERKRAAGITPKLAKAKRRVY